MNPHVDQFRDAIRAAGLTPPDAIIADGKRRRFASNGKRNDDAGWYVLHGDGIPAGAFGDWRTGVSETWRADVGRDLSPAERAAHAARVERMLRKREADEARRHEEAKAEAARQWAAATPARSHHPYLVRKGVQPHGIRQDGELLLVPMRDGDRQLWNVERIPPEKGAKKKGLPGGRRDGLYHSIGTPAGVIYITEGYATGATIHEATGHAVAVAFNAGNVPAVARTLRAKMPDARIVICADDDNRTAGNPGLTKATEAARAVGGLVAVPNFGADRPDNATDFNDLAQHIGAEAVRKAVEGARAPKASQGQPDAANATAGDPGPHVELLCAADVTPEAVRWHWDGWLAAGKLHILAGPAGTGKTTLALALAATITSGGRWPDGTRATVGNVAMWSGEDGIAETLVPRLIANGADSVRITFVRGVADQGGRRPFDPATDVPALMLALARLPEPPALLIVDPIVSAVAGDSHKNSETRRALQPLVELGERIGCAILGISHFSKGTSGRDPVERVTGSLAFAALARVVLAAVKTTTNEGAPGPRLFARAKNNLGPDAGGFHYSITQAAVPGAASASRLLWGEPVDGEARELLAKAERTDDPEEREALDDARTWLVATLADAGGSMDRREITAAAKRAGFPERTVYRARTKAGVHAASTGFGSSKRSVWTLPATADNTASGGNIANSANTQSLAGMARMDGDGKNDEPGEVF